MEEKERDRCPSTDVYEIIIIIIINKIIIKKCENFKLQSEARVT